MHFLHMLPFLNPEFEVTLGPRGRASMPEVKLIARWEMGKGTIRITTNLVDIGRKLSSAVFEVLTMPAMPHNSMRQWLPEGIKERANRELFNPTPWTSVYTPRIIDHATERELG